MSKFHAITRRYCLALCAMVVVAVALLGLLWCCYWNLCDLEAARAAVEVVK